MAFRSVPYDSLSLNPFTKIGKEWALLTPAMKTDSTP